MNKWFRWVFIFAFLISGCVGNTAAPIVNAVVFSFPGRDETYYRSLLNEFNVQNPGITVRLEPVAGINLSAQTGDVQVITWGINDEELSWTADNYLDLKSFIDKDGTFESEDFFPGTLIPFTSNVIQVGIPYGMDLDALFFNRDIQQQLMGPNSTWNWDSFLATAAQLTDRAHNTYGYAAKTGYADSLYFLYQNGGNLLDDEGKPALSADVNIQALGWYARLFTTLNVAPTIEQAQKAFGYSKDVFNLGIANGKVGMWAAPFSTRDTSASAGAGWTFQYGMTTLPAGKNNATSGEFEAYAISKDAKNKEASWKLVNFLSTKQHPRLVPARPSIATSVEYARTIGADSAAVAISSASNIITVSHDQAANFIKARKAFLEAASNVIKRVATPEQALKAGQESITP